jgi:hypothetical protein
MPAKYDCIVVLVHGIGDQKEDRSQDFRKDLKSELGTSSKRVKINDAYWAPL